MADINQLQQEEIVKLQDKDEFNLEELILLGDEKKIPIVIEFPTPEGKKVKAKALVKQLTLKEIDKFQLNQDNVAYINKYVLKKALFKNNGESFTDEELAVLPMGVVNAIVTKIVELSGVDINVKNQLVDF